MQAPPTALILLSAVLEKNLALTMTGWLGSLPLPKTLKYPALVTSMTGALSFSVAYFFLVSSLTKLHNLSILTVGQWYWFLFKWKCLISFFPKYPGWLCEVSYQVTKKMLTIWSRGFLSDAYHQRYLYRQDAFYVCRLYRNPFGHDLWAFWSF